MKSWPATRPRPADAPPLAIVWCGAPAAPKPETAPSSARRALSLACVGRRVYVTPRLLRQDRRAAEEPGATQEPGLRAWLHELPRGEERQAAAFDTRLDKSPLLTGVAARGIARRLGRRGYQVIGQESFLVEDSEGPLEEGELDRARADSEA